MTERVPRRRRTKAEIERAKKKALSARKHWLKSRHHMSLEQYDELKAFQDGLCAICRRSNGRTKALAVEHNHAIAREACDHPHQESCINCWRGLCCGPCNDMLAWARDDIMVFWRVIDYLRNPPARRWHGQPLRQMRPRGPSPNLVIYDEMLMPCILCGQQTCPLGVATCVECDTNGKTRAA